MSPEEQIENTDKPILWVESPSKTGEATKKIRQVAFLKAFAECGIISKACRATGINVKTEQSWRNSQDVWYREGFKNAYQAFRDRIEDEIAERAIVGTEVPIIGKVQTPLGAEDKIIGHKTVKSDLLLMFLAKRHVAEYKDNAPPTKDDEKPVETISPLTRITLNLNMMGERERQVIDVTPEKPALPSAKDEDDT